MLLEFIKLYLNKNQLVHFRDRLQSPLKITRRRRRRITEILYFPYLPKLHIGFKNIIRKQPGCIKFQMPPKCIMVMGMFKSIKVGAFYGAFQLFLQVEIIEVSF